MNNCWTICLYLSLLICPAYAGLFKRPLVDPAPVTNGLTKMFDPSDEKKVPEPSQMMPSANPHKPTVKNESDPKSTQIEMVADALEVQRKTNQVRVTLINLDDISTLTPAETMFFEDCFIAAFVESQNDADNHDDVNVRSMIVLLDESLKKKNRLRGNDRSLWSAPGGYFDIAAIFEWSCHLCGGSSSSSSRTDSSSRAVTDDDRRDDDFYYHGGGKGQRYPSKSRPTPPPKPRPTQPPKSRPTRSKMSMLDDDITHGDDDSLKNRTNEYDVALLGHPDSDTATTTSPTNDGEQESEMLDDDVYSVFFGKRILEETDELRFEELLCHKLRAGPFQGFHRVHDCFVVLTE